MNTIEISRIRIDGGTQMRAVFSEETVAEYLNVLNGDTELPPVVLFFDGTDYWMADGFHRYGAYVAADRALIPADVREGGQRHAFLYALGANSEHGMRRTVDDKRKAAAAALADEELSNRSDREIAKLCNVSNTFVSNIRNPKPPPASKQTPKPPAAGGTTGGDAGQGVNVDGPRPDLDPNPAPQPPAPPPSPSELDKAREEAHGDATLEGLVDELQAELVEARELLAAAEQDDAKAEVLKWKRIANIANTRQGELMDTNKEQADRIKWLEKQLDRIGKAVGEDDRASIAPTVEQFVRSMKVAS